MNNQNNTTRTKNSIAGPIVLLMVVVFVFSAGYLIFSFYFKSSAEDIEQQKQQAQFVQQPVVQDFPEETIASEQVNQLQHAGYTEYASQVHGTASSFPEPLQPSNVLVENTGLGNRILLSWRPASDGTFHGVEIYRSTQSQSTGQQIATVPVSEYEYNDTTVENGTTYYYTVRSYRDISGTFYYSPLSEEFEVVPSDTTPPSAPDVVTIEQSGDDNNTLFIGWEEMNQTDAVLYRIYRSQHYGVVGTLISEQPNTITKIEDTTVESGLTYYYTVTAVDATGNESSINLPYVTPGNSTPFIVTTTTTDTTTE